MSLLIFLIFGCFVGLIARVLLPGRQSMGLAMTTMVGAVGSVLGGLLGNMTSGGALGQVHPAGFVGSALGAVVMLAVTGFGGRRFSS